VCKKKKIESLPELEDQILTELESLKEDGTMKTSYKIFIVLAAVLAIGAAIGFGGNLGHAQESAIVTSYEQPGDSVTDATTAVTMTLAYTSWKTGSLTAGAYIDNLSSDLCPSGYVAISPRCATTAGKKCVVTHSEISQLGASSKATCGFANLGTSSCTVSYSSACLKVQ
jgi:hypothetical protein